MNFLLDTNAVSEWVKPRPNPGLIRWMDSIDEDRVFISVITIAELRYGVERLAEGRRKAQLGLWMARELASRFQGRTLPVNEEIAHAWGKEIASAEFAGRRSNVMDAFLAATAAVYSLTLVTRNIIHFSHLPSVVNPWS
ncbi:MAG TPA: type II toxin-antitoxin system VapC family toxin [Dongiaceae bacterium]|nr:type II toxin-antitoxin system VapC family toxin [Dongiaceae bacterium]